MRRAKASSDGMEALPGFESVVGGEGVTRPASPYVPILQNKHGEFDALRKADQSVLDALLPVMVFVGPADGTAQLELAKIRNWAKNVRETLGRRSFAADVARLNPVDARVEGSTEPSLRVIHSELTRAGVGWIPTVGLRPYPFEAEIVRAACLGQRCGLVLRVRLDRPYPGASPLSRLIEDTVHGMGCQPVDVDLLLDLNYLKSGESPSPELMVAQINSLPHLAYWRTLVLAGTSMPASLARDIPDGETRFLKRLE